MLEFRNVTKRFGDTIAVNDVSVSIPRGSMVAIIGRSGAGKSTLLRTVNRLSDPTSGDILWNGRSIAALGGPGLRAWRKTCAMIFQQFHLAPRLDVLTNVLVGTLHDRPLVPALFRQFPRDLRLRAINELAALDMGRAALQRAQTLSGGQQQRVAIARAMMQDPELILADEPIASLDVSNAHSVMAALQRINAQRGITVVVNLHTLDMAQQYCGRIIGMADGRIVFDDLPSRLTPDAMELVYKAPPRSAGVEIEVAA